MGVSGLPADALTTAADRVAAAASAASRVAADREYARSEPVVLQRTNNVVVWLRPHAIVAKVGTRAHSHERLAREHTLASVLAEAGAPVAVPAVAPVRDAQSGLVVTLWHQLEHDPGADVAPTDVASSLGRLHEGLVRYRGELPSFRLALARARAALADDRVSDTLTRDEIALLHQTFERGGGALDARATNERPLHGEPHRANLLVTPAGLRWIDLEDACRGPLEWDLAFLPDEAAGMFAGADPELLTLLRTLNSARVATWCALRPEYDELRWHREHHLERVRANRALCL
ncbi:MAG: phosphotransferase [Thermoleophilia bacterium]|nr:phosphotransferase [Thermoleophilia bacterium]